MSGGYTLETKSDPLGGSRIIGLCKQQFQANSMADKRRNSMTTVTFTNQPDVVLVSAGHERDLGNDSRPCS
jgi:hypothetical protein